MTGVMKAAEILLERFFTNFRSLYTDKFEAQTMLSKAQYSLQPILESGEIFLIYSIWHENLDTFIRHKEKFLIALEKTSLDGLALIEVSERGEAPYKLLRVV